MLIIQVPTGETQFNPETDEFEFITRPLHFEHTLKTVAEWEAEYQKPFLSQSIVPEDKRITDEEMLDYIHSYMLIPGEDRSLLLNITREGYEELQKYINSPQTATWFKDDGPKKPSQEIVTAELVYYWMFSFGIPIELEGWHFNRLLTLIRVFASKQDKPKPMSRREIAQRNAALNAQRKAKYKTRG